jgi:hypothetical protein
MRSGDPSAAVSHPGRAADSVRSIRNGMTVRFFSGAAVAVLAASTLAGGAQAKRPPSLSERAAITLALPAYLRNEPVGCVWLDVSVSNNGKYAIAAPVYLNARQPPCARYASNGQWILRKTNRWKVVFNGSDPPMCSLGVPKDLVSGCLR